MSNLKFKLIKEIQTKNLPEFQASAKELEKYFTNKSVIALSGPMGAGKTEFVKSLAESKGVSGVSSPTFAIHHRYQSENQTLEHLDLYRLKSEDDLESTGFWDLFLEPESLILIEWPERMNLANIPADWKLWKLEIQMETQMKELSLSQTRKLLLSTRV